VSVVKFPVSTSWKLRLCREHAASRIQWPSMRMPLWLKLLWTAWVLAWAPFYLRQYGLQNFLFFCDLGNFFIAVGLWLESPLIFSWQATGLLLFQSLYTIDLAGALITGRHIIGGTEYMFDPAIPLLVRLLSLFHLVMPPLLLWAIWRLGYNPQGWKLQTLTTWIVVPINYFWRPELDINWARGPFFREQHVVPGPIYLLAYLILVPAAVYFPTHVFLAWLARKRNSPDQRFAPESC
jgi:hypothetical protein